MPMSIKMFLSSINLYIGNPEDDENDIQMLIETGATMNIRSLEYHLWVLSYCHEMVKEYL